MSPSENQQPEESTTPGFGHVQADPSPDTVVGALEQNPQTVVERTNDPSALVNQQAERAAQILLEASGAPKIDLACTLGSGWGEAAAQLGEPVAEVSAAEIPGFHASAVSGHPGTLRVLRTASGAHILVIGARTHFYEGRGVAAVAHGVRTAAAAGATTMVLTNGCGGLNPEWTPGTPVLIKDHINLTGTSSLAGAHFVDMTDLYSQRLRDIAHQVDPSLAEGVYAQFPGPHYETPAEVRYAGIIGADLVGMSTALEAIAARAAGMEVFGISLVTNLAAGISDEPLSHQEVLEAGAAAAPRIADLLAKIITHALGEQHA